ncbi:MAG: response regulator, partial [Cyanobacteriota bacterium]|nr:response regulator [Cyanobacteriota bacterium]
MCKSLLKILLIEDNPAEARLLQEVLKSFDLQQFCLVRAKRLGEALNLLHEDCFDAILLDLTLPDSVGLDSLKPLIAEAPRVPIVVLTNMNDDRLALEAVRRGAQDYLVKRHVNVEVLVRSLHYAIERKRVAERLREEKR